ARGIFHTRRWPHPEPAGQAPLRGLNRSPAPALRPADWQSGYSAAAAVYAPRRPAASLPAGRASAGSGWPALPPPEPYSADSGDNPLHADAPPPADGAGSAPPEFYAGRGSGSSGDRGERNSCR